MPGGGCSVGGRTRVYCWVSCMASVCKVEGYIKISIYQYIYIYTRFQKGFHIERYIDRYILLFSCTCARVHLHLLLSNL